MAGLVPAIHVVVSVIRRGCPRRQVYAACASLAASAGMTRELQVIPLYSNPASRAFS